MRERLPRGDTRNSNSQAEAAVCFLQGDQGGLRPVASGLDLSSVFGRCMERSVFKFEL